MSWGGLDPDAVKPVGRQPALRVYTPSKPNPWHGTIIDYEVVNYAQTGGERFTGQQVCTLHEMELNPATVEVITVKRQPSSREWGVPRVGELPDVFAFDCPVIERRRDGKIKVISPSGNLNWIEPTGWVSPPSTRPYRGGY